MKRILMAFCSVLLVASSAAQTGLIKVYNEDINPLEQIDHAIDQAKAKGKFVVCQVGGNWCPWCLRFADFISKDTTISKVIDENFLYSTKMARCFTYRIPASLKKVRGTIRRRCFASSRTGRQRP